MLKMLVAVDGSEHAMHAIEAVAKLAHESPDVDVELLNVRDSPPYLGDFPPLDYESQDSLARRRQDELLTTAQTAAQRLGIKSVTTKGVMGPTAAEIVREAEERGVDEIVMGTHGRGAMGSLFVGSIAQRVLHLSKVPVMLVK